MQSARWCFTSFEESVPFDSLPSHSKYLIFQQEKCPSTEKVHYQGFFILKRSQRLTWLKKNVSVKWHMEPAKGNNEQNRSYCSKDDSRIAGPWSYGTFAEKGSNKRKVMERFQEDPDELRRSDPKIYRRCLADVVNSRFNDVTLPKLDRQWQIELRQFIDHGADDRTICWVYGSAGNEGKSTFAKKLIQEGWFYSRGGKQDDVLYQYLEHGGHAVFDLPRDKQDYVSYSCLEAIKDRIVICNKYEPVRVNYDNKVHVIVMANFMPPMEDVYDDKGKIVQKAMLSSDRLVLIECYKPMSWEMDLV